MNKLLLPRVYTPSDYEEGVYYKWESSGFFNPDNLPGKRRKNFSIVLPPPNVTGKLHIGHAAMLAYQDIMIRYHRLKGERTLWLPGMDHAAIATQSVVEKDLNKEGKTRYDLGREKFLDRVHQFVESAKITIRNQLKAMGSSLDWSREKFTLDKDVSYAVRTVFKKMYDDGLIYRGNRVVNWCTKCQSTLADDEVEYTETPGRLYYIKYGPLVIATTRPETKLGDTGVAVNPHDKRYQSLIGRKLVVDLAGHKLIVKVFSDRGVNPTFGTGAIGVTPGHSQQDFQWAEKYKLSVIRVINEQGKMTANAGKYQGLTTLECREQFIRDLEKSGLIGKVEDYTNNLSVCYRCATPVEPLISKQWFVAVNKKIPGRGRSLKELASDFIQKKEIQIIPERFNRTFFQWMDNLRDWCISRQIWYGHQIPVWYRVRNMKKMGFYESVIPQLYEGKTKTYRLRDHEFKIGDEVSFENSQTGEIFGQGEIVNIEKTIVSKINLQDKAHGATYNSATELIKAFKKHHPDREVTTGTEVFIYTYRFSSQKSIEDNSKEIIAPQNITEIVLVRHGLTDWNKIGKYHGCTEVPLDELSIDLIKKAWPQFKKEDFDLIISSPLMRARQTAAIINEELKLPLEVNELLTERNYGAFEGITRKEIKEKYPDYFKDKINFAIPGAESYQALAKRAEKFLKQIIKKHPNKKILLVCHTAVIRAFKMVIKCLNAAELTQFSSPFPQFTKFSLLDDQYKLANFRQDEDTLDTWFSSSLWTFSTLGWPASVPSARWPSGRGLGALAGRPNKTKDLKNFHPTSVLETMYDILFFWVARMMMLSAYVLKEKPFSTVYLHAMVKDKLGRKMSKSLGNGIDPLEVIKKFGADALRLSMIIGVMPGGDVRLYEEKIAGYRNFVNKLWNISRYILSNVKEIRRIEDYKTVRLRTLADQWILYEFNQIIKSTTKNIEEFRFSQAGEELYEFTWSKLADWYLEIAKIEKDKDEILLYILEKLLILWHPFCPYVTEVLWESFGLKELLMVQKWPNQESGIRYKESGVIDKFGLIQTIITAIRNARSEHQINPKKVYCCSITSKEERIINENKQVIEGLAKVKIVPQCFGQKIHLTRADITLDIKVHQEVVKDKEKEIKNLERYIKIQQAKFNNQEFIKKAPQAVVQAEKEKLELAKIKLGKLAD